MYSLQDTHNDRKTCINSEDKKTERIELVDVNNSLQETSRELPWDYDNNKGFSMFGLVESLLSVIASGLGTVVNSILGSEKKNSRTQTNRINYRNYQLIRVFPNTESHVVDLRDLADAEPEDVKFWSFPSPNRFVYVCLEKNNVFKES